MATLYLLNVPEFEPLRLAMTGKPGVDVTELGNYTRLSSPGELRVRRQETGLGKAVWYGALTGGYEGSIVLFNDDQLTIADD